MAEGFSFELNGLEAIVSGLDNWVKDFDERLDVTLTRIALKIIDDARRLAPIDEGDLEAALNVGEVKKMVNSMYIDLGASPEVDSYATVQHEGFRKTASGTIVAMTPGKKTLSKGMHGGYMPGKKFLENALKMNEQYIIEELSKILKG